MKPIKFKEQNCTFGENQKEYRPLPAFREYGDPQGKVVACWGLSFKERLIALFTGRVYVCLLTFHKPLAPSIVTVDKYQLFRGKPWYRTTKIKMLIPGYGLIKAFTTEISFSLGASMLIVNSLFFTGILIIILIILG